MNQRVIVVGAGPVGLATALTLATRGVAVQVLEKRDGLSQASRASTFHAPTLDMLDDLGVLAPVAALGRRVDEIQYYRCTPGKAVLAARFRLAALAGATRHPYRLHLEQSRLTPLLLDAVLAHPGCAVRFGAEMTGLVQDDQGVTVRVRRGTLIESMRASWLVGADGANSSAREAAGIAFKGEDYDKRVLRVMTTTDLARVIPGLAGISYLHAGDESISLLAMPEVWRMIIRLPAMVDDDTALDYRYIVRQLRSFLPVACDLPLASTDIYRVSQRVASAYRAGRVLLAGDAAHVTNTRGGMNMNCGLHDARVLGGALADAMRGDATTLDCYARTRRAVATDELIPRTERAVSAGSDRLDELAAIAADPRRAFDFMRRAAMLDIAPAAGVTTGERA